MIDESCSVVSLIPQIAVDIAWKRGRLHGIVNWDDGLLSILIGRRHAEHEWRGFAALRKVNRGMGYYCLLDLLTLLSIASSMS